MGLKTENVLMRNDCRRKIPMTTVGLFLDVTTFFTDTVHRGGKS